MNRLCSHNGFTLIEIAAVLIIIAIMTTLAVKHMGDAGISAYGDADSLVADLRYAQSLAMTRSQNITVAISKSNRWKWEISDFSFADGSKEREPKHGVTFPSGSKIEIEFLAPQGTVVSEKTIELKRGKKIVKVKVYETGYVEIQ